MVFHLPMRAGANLRGILLPHGDGIRGGGAFG
jgi:hypothetical protein